MALPIEHQQLFDFAFEHFSGGRWQRAHHNRSLMASTAAKGVGAGAGGVGGSKVKPPMSSSPTSPSFSKQRPLLNNSFLSDDAPCLGLNALTSLFLGVGCLIGTTDEIRERVANVCAGRRRVAGDTTVAADTDEPRLSYNEALSLAASLPSVLPPQLYQTNYERRVAAGTVDAASSSSTEASKENKRGATTAANAEFDGVGASSHSTKVGGGEKRDVSNSSGDASAVPSPLPPPPSSFTMNLPQIMEAIRLFTTFQKNSRLPLQSLRTVLLTMGEEPLTEAELNYLLYPFVSKGGDRNGEGLTLLQYLELFKLL